MNRPFQLWSRYKLRLRRKRLLWRAYRKRHEIVSKSRKVNRIRPDDVLLFSTMRNEMQRLPFFLRHYRQLGVGHFLIVDNNSTDGSSDYLASQDDVSVWSTEDSYKAARFGMDWLTALQWRFGSGHWILTADADELFVYPECDKRPLKELTKWLQHSGIDAVGAMMIELYPKGPISTQSYCSGDDPTEILNWFDAYGYWVQRQTKMDNLWLQGGPRARYFFAQEPQKAPTLNKIPLVHWKKSYVFVNSTHNMLPARLNHVYDADGEVKLSGALLHTKFLPDVVARASEEKERQQHFADAEKYRSYYDELIQGPDFWCADSVRYEGWQQLEKLGLMSRGRWPQS